MGTELLKSYSTNDQIYKNKNSMFGLSELSGVKVLSFWQIHQTFKHLAEQDQDALNGEARAHSLKLRASILSR